MTADTCPTCGSEKRELRKLVQDDTCLEYGGPSLWDRCTDDWHNQRLTLLPHLGIKTHDIPERRNKVANELVTKNKIKPTGLRARVAAEEQAKTFRMSAALDAENRIGLMLDVSGSMRSELQGKRKIEHLRDAMDGFIKSCDFSTTSVAYETFPSGSQGGDYEDMPFQAFVSGRPLCNDEALLSLDMAQLRANGSTPMHDALETILKKNSLTRGVLVSDGEADSPSDALRIAEQWCEASIQIDCVHIGDQAKGEALLKQIAEMTGGIFIKFENVSSFAKSFKYLSPGYYAMLTSGQVTAEELGAKEIK